jgi:hypothetical protein
MSLRGGERERGKQGGERERDRERKKEKEKENVRENKSAGDIFLNHLDQNEKSASYRAC